MSERDPVGSHASKRSICWLRRDLRLSDHSALAAATRQSDEVVVAFVLDVQILDRLEDRDDRRVSYIMRSLAEVDARLREAGSRLVLLHGDPVEQVPMLAAKLGASAVYANRDTEPYAVARDGRVGEALRQDGRSLQTVKDQVVFEGLEIANSSGEPFRVFTPYSRAWLQKLQASDLEARHPDLSKLCHQDAIVSVLSGGMPDGWDLLGPADPGRIGFQPSPIWLEPGETAALERLAWFESRIDRYALQRDYPAVDATSGISVHLRHGTLSVREALRAARRHPGPGGDKWLMELVWREFYQMILACFPHVVDRSFQPQYDGLEWPGEEAHLEAWKSGATGYPIVDAAMRCLNATGWMHNRLRMVAASFLTKDLLHDWRLGEAYFARRLLDYDLASNNGGWQWAASTGVDAQPYFRIFNPVLQSLKFDPDGAFIRRWVPELSGLEGKGIHWPLDAGPLELAAAGIVLGRDYPLPIVDHHEQKTKALALLSSARPAPDNR